MENNIFKKVLIELRTAKKLNQRQLAKETNLSQSAISYWETGDREPTANALITLALFFDVSTDYLLGLEDEWGNKINMDAMAHREEYQKPMAKMAAHSKGVDEPIQEFEYTREIKKLFDAIPDEMDENKDKK